MHKTFGILAPGLALLLAACTPPSSSNGGGNGTNPPSEVLALLYEANSTKALAITSDGTYLYVAGFRQGDHSDGLQDALVWKLNAQGQVVAQKRIGSERMPGGWPYVRVNDRAYALALDGDYLYVAGYLAGCDDSNQDTCGGYPFVAKLRKDDLEFVQGFGGNYSDFNQPGLAVLDQVEPSERSYAYTVTADENHLYVGGFGNVSSSASKGFLAVLDKSTGQEQKRLVLGGSQDGAVAHVEAVLRGNEAVDIAFGSTLYIAGHTNVPFDCTGNPTGPVEARTFGFLIRVNIGDILDGNLCSNPANVVYLSNTISTEPEELLALTITTGNSTRLFAAGICAFGPFGEGDITFTLSGQACLSQLDPVNGNRVYSNPTYPDPNNYPGKVPSNCSENSPGLYKCADQARSAQLASDGSVLVTGHVKGSRQGPDRFPGTEDGLSGSDLFFARYNMEGHQVAYTLKDYGGGTDLGFAVVQGPGGYYYVAGATTGPLGNASNSNPKAIVLRFGP